MGRSLRRLGTLAFCLLACAQRDEVLTIYTSLDSEAIQEVDAKFEAFAGKRMDYVRLSTGEALTRIRTEASHPRAALWLAGPAIEFINAATWGLLEPYEPKLDYSIDVPNRAPDWAWTGAYFGAIAFLSSKPFLEKNRLPPPTSWNELLSPSYRGKISYAYPTTSGTALVIVVSLVSLLGENPAFDYFAKLHAQVHHYTKSGSACVNEVSLGETGVCIAFDHDMIAKSVRRGYPVALSYPIEGTGWEISGLALLKNGTTPELGKRFIDWMLGSEGQNLLSTLSKGPMDPRIDLTPPARPRDKIKLAPIDMNAAAASQGKWVARWKSVTNQ